MSTRKKIAGYFSALAFAGLTMFALSASAKLPDGQGKRQLDTCAVTSGGVVTQIGNTCSGSGSGCTPNPCG